MCIRDSNVPVCTQLGCFSGGVSLFCKNNISVVTSVPAFSKKALLGNRIAPNKSALSDKYFLTLSFSLSNVPLLVINATIPPVFTLSNVLDSDR